MKLRVEKNSLRLRVRPSDVVEFSRTGRIEASVDFGSGARLVYRLLAAGSATQISASWHDCSLDLTVPERLARQWAEGDDVAIEATQDAGEGGSLRILIEKDFKCMHKDAEANADAYPNPMVLAN